MRICTKLAAIMRRASCPCMKYLQITMNHNTWSQWSLSMYVHRITPKTIKCSELTVMAFIVDISVIPDVWDQLADYSHVLKFNTVSRHFSPVDYWKWLISDGLRMPVNLLTITPQKFGKHQTFLNSKYFNDEFVPFIGKLSSKPLMIQMSNVNTHMYTYIHIHIRVLCLNMCHFQEIGFLLLFSLRSNMYTKVGR